ncbi:MAG: alkaline phosphatase family protein, partial [Clostridia bacterium]|nr:alkaline phosphatase family protein [Clostridia bacterium]
MVIGLDCAEPDLLFGPWLEDLPNLRQLVRAGVSGRLRSCTPPITVPAWMCMLTGRDPGELGIYGFRNRSGYGYADLAVTTSLAIRTPTVWDVLGAEGKHCIVLGVPPTYPPKPLRGELIACFLTPGREHPFTYPPELRREVAAVVGEYLFDVPGFRGETKHRLLQRIYDMTERRFALARHLLQTRPWDFFVMVEMGIDRIQHAFWQFMDAGHALYRPGSPFATAIRDYYRFVDAQVGELLAWADEDTCVLVVSDHGAQRMEGGFCLNEWLAENGYLSLRHWPARPTRFEELEVDWPRTLAWGEGGYYGRVFLNVRGREPEGAVAPEEAERLRAELAERLEALADPSGRPMGTRVVRPEDVYPVRRGIPPDLMVFFGDLAWRSVGSVGHGSVHVLEDDVGPDGANHDWEGVFVLAEGRDLARGPAAGRRLE